MPKVVSASISSVTFIVPSCAAKAAPVRPAMMMPDDHRAHLAHHRDPDQVGDVEVGAEQSQLHGAHEGQDQADDHADQRDDRQRSAPAACIRAQEIRGPKLRAERAEAAQGECHAGR